MRCSCVLRVVDDLFFPVILTQTILSRKQFLSLRTWSVTHPAFSKIWILIRPCLAFLSASTIFSNVIATQLPEACHASRRATRAWTVLTQTPSYSTGRTLPVHRHIRAFVANCFPLRPISSVMQCDAMWSSSVSMICVPGLKSPIVK